MSLALDIFKIGSEVLTVLLKADRTQRFEVAEHFSNLSRTFKSYPAAHRAEDRDQITFLVGKTLGLIEALRGTGIFTNVLGEDKEKRFFSSVNMVLNLKDLMATANYTEPEAGYSEIMAVAGYFEGYSESLRAQAGKL
jgi:hypothetical protein